MILIIDDDIAVRTSLNLLLKQEGFQAISVADPGEAWEIMESQPPELILLDMNFSVETSGKEGLTFLTKIKETNTKVPVILITGWGSILLAVEGMKAGAADFIAKPWNNQQVVQSVKTAISLSQQEMKTKTSLSRKKLDEKYDFSQIVGKDPELLSVLDAIGRVSVTDAPILIQGESGTGKELIAEAIHRNSQRRSQAFIKVNLGGIPASLFESEMFGHKKGAFTDAKSDRIGRFQMAHKGSIFLDEIGELDMRSQVKLLRVLQDHSYEVLGESTTRTADVRVICATNRSLAAMVESNQFREDLLYRINLITVKIPAIRERPGDIPLLVDFFINNLKKQYHREQLSISRKALNWLKELPFPGNIRELRNLIERTVLVSKNEVLEKDDFIYQLQPVPKRAVKKSLPEVGAMTLEEMEVTMIKKALEFHNNNISKVARSLGLSRGALYRRLDKFNIPYEPTQ